MKRVYCTVVVYGNVRLTCSFFIEGICVNFTGLIDTIRIITMFAGKQREAYQNSKKVNKYRKTLKHLAEEGHEFKPRVPLDMDAEVIGLLLQI